MDFIKRWLEKRRKAVEVLVMDVMRQPRMVNDEECLWEEKIVEGVRSSWPDELEWKPWLVTSLEVGSALDRLVRQGKLRRSQFYRADGPKSVSTQTFTLAR